MFLTFLKNFGWVTEALKWVKGLFSPLAIVVIIILGLLLGGNYYFFKQAQVLKKNIKIKEKKIKDFNSSMSVLQKEYLQSVQLSQTQKMEFKDTLDKIKRLHEKRLMEVENYAKQKEKNRYLEDGTIAPVLRSTLDGLFQETNDTNATTR